jgi:hypothetical protein
VFFAIILELFIFHTLPSFLSLVGVSIILTSAAWVAVSARYSLLLGANGRSRRKHQTLLPGTKNHCLCQGLLRPCHHPISDLRVVVNITRIRQFRPRRRHISVRRVAMARARVDRHYLSLGTQGLVSICIAYLASRRFHDECTYCLTYYYGLECAELAARILIFMPYVYYTIYTLLMKLLNDKSLYSSSGGRSSNLIISFGLPNDNKTHPSRILLAETGPFVSFFFCASPSADTLNRSRTSPVFIDPRPEFC